MRAEFLRRLRELAWPVALQGVLAASFALLDTWMVAGLGADAMAGAGLVGRLYMFVGMMLGGLAGAVGILATQRAAGSSGASAAGVAGTACWLAAPTMPLALWVTVHPDLLAAWLAPEVAVSAAAAEFLRYSAAVLPLTALAAVLGAQRRAVGDTRHPLFAGLLALAINTTVNVFFIEGRFGLPALGLAAAAGGMALGRGVECLWLLARSAAPVRRALLALPSSAALRELCLLALPLAAKEAVWAAGVMAFALLIARMGAVPLAAFNLVLPVEGLMISGVFGAAVAAGILLGHRLGRAEFAEAKAEAALVLAWVTRLAALGGVLLAGAVLLWSWRGGGLAGVDAEVARLALPTLAVFCLAFGAKAHNTVVAVGILRAGGDNAWILWVDLCSMWLFSVPLVAFAVLSWQWPLPAVLALMMAEEVVKIGLFRRRVRAGHWLRRL